ncbi:MAG: hypothetical protein R3300_14615 [Candidatus Promineifilaceae bacterium]|nr:hypothetical protein [Candidatus Promineifilaceae bacterium]
MATKVKQKLEFVEEERCQRNSFFNGRYHDDILFVVIREEVDGRMKR